MAISISRISGGLVLEDSNGNLRGLGKNPMFGVLNISGTWKLQVFYPNGIQLTLPNYPQGINIDQVGSPGGPYNNTDQADANTLLQLCMALTQDGTTTCVGRFYDDGNGGEFIYLIMFTGDNYLHANQFVYYKVSDNTPYVPVGPLTAA